jgi:hypothetical protein
MEKIILLISLFAFSEALLATPLSDTEKADSIRGEVPACIAKQSANRGALTVEMKSAIVKYCNCHATVFASLSTREEFIEFTKGRVPDSMRSKVIQAQQQCIGSLKNSS